MILEYPAIELNKLANIDIMIQELEGEIWKNVDGYEGRYRVSNLGRVKSLIGNAKILKSSYNRGYVSVLLSNRKISKRARIHRLVAICFLPEPTNDRVFVNHLNGIKDDNRVENLEWCTHLENVSHAVSTGLMVILLGCENPNAKFTHNQVVDMRQEYSEGSCTYRELGDKYGIDSSSMWLIVKRKSYSNIP